MIQPFRCDIPIAQLLFQNLLFVERFTFQKSYDLLKSVEILQVNEITIVLFSNGLKVDKTYLIQDEFLAQKNDQKVNYKLCEYEIQASSLLSVLACWKCTILDKFHRPSWLIELYFELSQISQKCELAGTLIRKIVHQKGLFEAIKENPNFPNCRRIFHIYWQWLLKHVNTAFNSIHGNNWKLYSFFLLLHCEFPSKPWPQSVQICFTRSLRLCDRFILHNS